MARKKNRFLSGDVFLVPSTVKGAYFGQVAADVRLDTGAIFCFFFKGNLENISENKDIFAKDPIAANLVTPELVESGVWEICSSVPVLECSALKKLDRLRASGFVGATIHGAGLVAQYLDYRHGLIDLSHWAKPEYAERFFNGE